MWDWLKINYSAMTMPTCVDYGCVFKKGAILWVHTFIFGAYLKPFTGINVQKYLFLILFTGDAPMRQWEGHEPFMQ